MIYLDHAATTPVSPSVICAMLQYLMDAWGNPGSDHPVGRRAAKAVEKARGQVADLMHCRPEQVIFTSGGTEANSLAILGTLFKSIECGKTHLILSPVEHDSVYQAAMAAKRLGFSVDFLPLDADGHLDVGGFAALLKPETALVSLMSLNNETGLAYDTKTVFDICKKHGVLFHSDCVQALPEDPTLSLERADLISVSAHKIRGPKGIGALIVRDPTKLLPIIPGSESQEFGLRGGTENVPAIVGFGQAAFELAKRRSSAALNEGQPGRVFLNTLAAELDKRGLSDKWKPGGNILPVTKPNGDRMFFTRFSDRILSLSFPDVDAQTLVLLAGERGLCISSGAACSSHSSEPSRVLLACGYSPELARQTVRVSTGDATTYEDVVNGAKTLASCVFDLQPVSHSTITT